MGQNTQTTELTKDAMREFARAATIRAVRTMAQTAASLLGAKALISDVDWKALVSATVMAGILSILTSVYTGLPETGTASPKITKEAGTASPEIVKESDTQ